MSVENTLDERAPTHGDFIKNTVTMQDLKNIMRDTPNWKTLYPYQRETLDMIAHKIGRILHGDPNHIDSWHDVAGYATLVERELTNAYAVERGQALLSAKQAEGQQQEKEAHG